MQSFDATFIRVLLLANNDFVIGRLQLRYRIYQISSANSLLSARTGKISTLSSIIRLISVRLFIPRMLSSR